MKVSFPTHPLLGIRLLREKIESFKGYPFEIPCIRTLDTLDFHPAVTFLVGENGSGKSTLVEAIAVAFGFNAEGGSRNFRFSTHATHSELSRYLRLMRGARMAKNGYFLRAESFYNVASKIDELDQIPSEAPSLNRAYGGKSLHARSHGESFMALMANRFRGNGLYILDEPEAALSPARQMAALVRIHELVNLNAQFIIATHSPILMAYPNARILLLSQAGITETTYEETEHFAITREFLNDHRRFLHEFLKEGDAAP